MKPRLVTVAISALVLVLTPVAASAADRNGSPRPTPYLHLKQLAAARTAAGLAAQTRSLAAGEEEGEDPEEIAEQAEQWAEARSAPGIVAPGAYSAAWRQQQQLPVTSGAWRPVTNLPYNSDDPRYRDIESNSSGGAGFVTGRVTGLAADDQGYVYAGAANGGVWRSRRRRRALAAHLRAAAVTVHRRPAAGPGGPALVRHRRGQHQRDLVRRHRRLRAGAPTQRLLLPGEPGRRDRAGEHDHPQAAVHRKHGVGGHQSAAPGPTR